MRDRFRDGFVLLLLAALIGCLPELSVRQGRIAAGLAVVTVLLLSRGAVRPLHRHVFLAGVLFLAVQPFAVDPLRAVPLPSRALWVLAAVLALWTHMNVQSVSGKLAWRFSSLDVGVLGACGLVVLYSLGLLWYRSDASDVVPQILLQGVALSCGVLYLYLSRWRPDRPAFRIAALALSALLLAGFGGSEIRGRRLEAREGDLERAWSSRPPEPGEVDSLLEAVRVARPDAAGDVLARASRAALRHGRRVAAGDWAELALAEAPGSSLPWLARAELAAAQDEATEAREALSQVALLLPGAGGPPAGLAFLPRSTAIAVAIELLDADRPAGALEWLEASEGSRDGAARLLGAECRLRLGRADEAERTLAGLLEQSPENVEVLLAVTRARLAGGDREGAWRSLRRATAAGAPRPLVLPLAAALGPDDDPEAREARAALAAGIVIVARDEWPDRHPNGNFLDGSAEDRRVPLLVEPGRDYELAVEARGTPARGEAPRLRIEASGRRLAEVPVGGDWSTYRVRLAPGTAMTTIRLSFPNDFFDPAGADRNLVVGTVRLQDPSLLS